MGVSTKRRYRKAPNTNKPIVLIKSSKQYFADHSAQQRWVHPIIDFHEIK